MLFKCSEIQKNIVIKEAEKINLVIDVKDRKSGKDRHFEIFLQPVREKSIFNSYHKICMVINVLLYISLIVLILQASKKFKQDPMGRFKLFSFVFIPGLLMFANSMILFHNILYLDYISGSFINMMFIIFSLYIISLVVFVIFCIICKYLTQDNIYQTLVNVFGIIVIILGSIIFLSMNISIFMNKIHATVLLLIFILISMLISTLIVYKCISFMADD